MNKKINAGIFAAIGASIGLVSPAIMAATASNNMTNIITIVDSCDIVAIGVDFGVNPGSIETDIVSDTPNTAAGAGISGNAAHPSSGEDGGAANDDVLELSTGVAAVDGSISDALDDVDATDPGVFVVCTTTPSSLVVDGAGTDATLDLVSATSTNDQFTSELVPDDENADGATGSIDYRLSFDGQVSNTAVAGVPGIPSIFTGSYTATGTVPAPQQATSGYYTDVAVATLTF